MLQVPVDDIDVVWGDTGTVTYGTGTFASRNMVVGGTAIFQAAQKVLSKMRLIAADSLGVEEEEVTFEGEFEEVPLGGYDPHAHIKDMEQDGVWGSVVYPSVGLFLFSIPTDEELLRASIAAYNNWLADFCKPYPDRLKGIAMVLLDDNVEAGISELERTASLHVVIQQEPFVGST